MKQQTSILSLTLIHTQLAQFSTYFLVTHQPGNGMYVWEILIYEGNKLSGLVTMKKQ